MSRVGLIARCDNRGIAYQTLEFFNHMHPDEVLVVKMNDPKWPEDERRFGPNAMVVNSNMQGRRLSQQVMRRFLERVDVVFAVETIYDWRMIELAEELHVEVIIQGNPEFYRHDRAGLPHPHVWTWPTEWMLDDLPPGPLIPVPAPDALARAGDPERGALRVLHVAGHAAANDRNGTLLLVEALQHMASSQPIELLIVGQDGSLPDLGRVPRNVRVVANPHGVRSRWDMYHDRHLVVLPRRYGGNCLPAYEAMAAGCAVLMPNCSPNMAWPGPRVEALKGRVHRAPFGPIGTHTVRPKDLGEAIVGLATSRGRLSDCMAASSAWAKANHWDVLGPDLYRPLLEGSL